MRADHNQPAACFSPVDRYSGYMEMDSEKYIHFGGGTSSGERGDQILAPIKDKQMVGDSERGKDSGNDDVPEEVILSTASFVPQELIHFLQVSCVSASGCDNRLVLEVAKAQISILFVWRNCSRKLPIYSSLFAEPDNDPEAANVDFILMSQSSDEEKGNLTNEFDALVKGSKGLLLEEIDDGEGSQVGSTEGDLSKKITSSDTIMPNLESQASAGVPMTAAEKSSDHLQPTFSQIGPTKGETKQLK
ncbi:hypothetical protein MLD38_032549 [Melastoma candidum]|uniref:Uncharacterized protein n=1 Tax=Melastoma candidum TaxID=119954 RepID=A0ACB9M412_9MYRT|nr:hypothetical protein MLD38_032549 [Melastoma candidum]